MPGPKGELCRKCYYFDTPDSDDDEDLLPFEIKGRCRVNPPVIPAVGGVGSIIGEWPIVAGDEWCGSFRAK